MTDVMIHDSSLMFSNGTGNFSFEMSSADMAMQSRERRQAVQVSYQKNYLKWHQLLVTRTHNKCGTKNIYGVANLTSRFCIADFRKLTRGSCVEIDMEWALRQNLVLF